MTNVSDGPTKVMCFLFDPNVGGPTIRANLIYKALSNENYSLSFALPNTDGTAKKYLETSGLDVHRLGVAKPSLPKRPVQFLLFVLRAPFDCLKIYRFLIREKPSLIHVNGAFDLLPVLAAKLASVKVLWHLNDMVFGARLSRLLGRFVSNLADVVAVTSPPVAEHYGVAQDLVKILPVPVDTEKFDPLVKTAHSKPTLAMIGNWNHLKGQGIFIEVVNALRDQGMDVEGRLFGKFLDSQKSYWQPILDKLELQEDSSYIHLEGFTDNVPEALSKCDIFLIPSVSESGPMACVEASCAGLPVVSFDVGDVERMLGPQTPNECGVVVAQGSKSEMVKAVRTLLEDKKMYKNMSENGPKRVAEFYSIEAAAKATKEAYEAAFPS